MSANEPVYIYSTLASDVDYTNYQTGGGDMPIEQPPVRIKGGAGVTNHQLVTPRGVATKITEEQLAYLRENSVFKLHVENGFLVVSEYSDDADLVAADMKGRDISAPLVPQDNAAGDATVIVGGVPEDSDAHPATKTHKKK